MNTSTATPFAAEDITGSTPQADKSQVLLDKARDFVQTGEIRDAFQCATEALLRRPGDRNILAFIADLNYQPRPIPSVAQPGSTRKIPGKTPFDALPLVQHVRHLRQITGGSLGCGWINDELALLLYSLVKWFKPELVVQTGHLWGKSAMVVLESLNDGFLSPDSPLETEPQDADRRFTKFRNSNQPAMGATPKFISVDPAPSEVPRSDLGIHYLNKLHPNFEFHQMMSTEFFAVHGQRLANDYLHQRILGIVDGDHTYWGCVLDLEAFARLGARLIIVDDTMWLPHIGRAAKAFARRRGYQYLDLTWYNGVGVLFEKGDTMPTIHPRPTWLSWGERLSHWLYAIGGLRLMKLTRCPT